MEDDETLHEESREFRSSKNRSPMSPSRRVPLSQLDIAFSKVRSPSLRWPAHAQGLTDNQIREEYLAKSSPIEDGANDSPIKLKNMEYNEKTIKKNTTLDSILNTAKK